MKEKKHTNSDYKKLKNNLVSSQELIEKLEGQNEDLESFSYSVSHELKRNLRHISAYISFLKNDASEGNNEKYKSNVFSLEKATEELSEILKSMLSLSHMGPAYIHIQKFDPKGLLTEILRQLGKKVTETIKWEIGYLPVIETDPTMLQIVFANLIENAIKFSVLKQNPEIIIGSDENKNEYVFFVKDNGIGFDRKDSDKLFKMFNRLKNAEAVQGNGLGLVTVKRIVTSLGGMVWAYGEINQGSTFYFSIPKILSTIL